MVKKVVRFACIFLLLFCGSAFGQSLASRGRVLNHIPLASFTLPESGGLVVLGSLLISGATLLRRRRSARGEKAQ